MAHTKNQDLRQRTHEGIDTIMDRAESVRESGKDAMHHLKEKAILMRQNTDDYIKAHPEKSMLLAAGVGAAIGVLLTAFVMRKR